MVLAMYALSSVSIIPNLFRPLYERGVCEATVFLKQSPLFNEIYSMYIFVVGYLLPVAAFCWLYGRVCSTLARRRRDTGNVPSVIDSAQRRLTATAILLTAIFIAAIGMHFTCYALGW